MFAPGAQSLHRRTDLQHAQIIESASDDLQTDRKSGLGEAGGYAHGGLAGEIGIFLPPARPYLLKLPHRPEGEG